MHFSNHYDNRNYPNDPDQKFTYPGGFGLITYTQVDTHRFKWLIKVFILTCDLLACSQSVCMKSQWVSGLLTDPCMVHPGAGRYTGSHWIMVYIFVMIWIFIILPYRCIWLHNVRNASGHLSLSPHYHRATLWRSCSSCKTAQEFTGTRGLSAGRMGSFTIWENKVPHLQLPQKTSSCPWCWGGQHMVIRNRVCKLMNTTVHTVTWTINLVISWSTTVYFWASRSSHIFRRPIINSDLNQISIISFVTMLYEFPSLHHRKIRAVKIIGSEDCTDTQFLYKWI